MNTGTEDLVNRLQNTFKSHLTVLKDKFIAIPLSGGFDSRLVAAMNARYHPDSILCYTYGTEDNPEVGPAREIAGRLGLKWINIVYNSGLIKDFLHDEIFCRYYPYVSNLTGMFFLQDYFAVKYLKEKELVPDNTIFMSGYSGDFIAGSYITPAMKFNMDKDKICSLIYREYFRLVKLDKTKEATLLKMIADRIPSGNSEAWKVIEAWDMKERHAKFIVNSARVYNFFGFSYVFPLWDNLLLDYMLNIPYSLRFNRRLYELTLKNHIFKEQNLNLKHEINPLPSQKRYQRFKETIKPLLPGRIMNRFLDLGSPIMYDEITRSMREEIGSEMIIPPRQPNYYNSYIVQWYLHKIHEHLLQGGK